MAVPVLSLCVLLVSLSVSVSADEQDLQAEATNSGATAQKREAAGAGPETGGLHNSYGEPIPHDTYGPPHDGSVSHVSDIQLPGHAVYGPPELQTSFQDPPLGAYGPPAPVSFPSQSYEGPPPPVFKPRPSYGPPKHHGPPKPSYGPPKLSYGPPKFFGPKKGYGPPKPTYGAPFKPPKFANLKPIYGPPKPIYGPPEAIYGPPAATYGAPVSVSVPVQSAQDFRSVTLTRNIGGFTGHHSPDQGPTPPIYGTPLLSLPHDLKPHLALPTATYGAPVETVGGDLLVQDVSNLQYGPPQPDPDPRPPHPGVPAPPTPPHVLYDGWRPIPGHYIPPPSYTSIRAGEEPGPPPSTSNDHIHINLHQSLSHEAHYVNNQQGQSLNVIRHQFSDQNSNQHSENHQNQFSDAQITSGYSSVHHDALSGVDLNVILGGDTNQIDQSKAVFEAHYTEHDPQGDLAFITSSIPSGRPHDTYGAPPSDSLSGGRYPASLRQQGAKGLIPPSGIYGVPPGGTYGVPPPSPPSHLPIPYGYISGGGHSLHTGGDAPRRPIKFREPVPQGLIQHVGLTTHGKDHHGVDHPTHGPTYLPPPIGDTKDGGHGAHSVSLSIEPTSLYSLPHAGVPLDFQTAPSGLYGSPIDSYSVPLLTVADHTASGSDTNTVTATVEGNSLDSNDILADLSGLDAAEILKHCPYHEAILKAARSGEKISAELASKYVASLSSLGSSLSKNLISQRNSFSVPSPGSAGSKDLSTASHTLVQSVVPAGYEHDKYEKLKGKALRDTDQNHKDDKLKYVSDQIFKTSEKIKSLSEQAKRLQQKIASTDRNVPSNGQNVAVQGQRGTYSFQIQSSNGKDNPTIPHDQLLSEGLLQSILQAIEQPGSGQGPSGGHIVQTAQSNTHFQNSQTQQNNVQNLNYRQPSISSNDFEGLVLPAGYEPVDRTKDKKDQEVQSSNRDTTYNSEHKHRGDIPDCDQKGEHSIQHSVVVAPSDLNNIKPVQELQENDVAIFFDKEDKNEPITEISVATSISGNEEEYQGKEFGAKIKKT